MTLISLAPGPLLELVGFAAQRQLTAVWLSLTSMLEDHGMNVSFAENGKDAVALLRERQDFDLVLMDVMMPEMDGYETTRAIREMPTLKSLPIIALTAKAMKGDREKCIAAGASDYITKPVDPDQLLLLLRGWLNKARTDLTRAP